MEETTTKFSIGGNEYDVVKRGLAQARQVAQIGKWLGVYGLPTIRDLDGDKLVQMNAFEVILQLLTGLSEDALVELFSLVFGCDVAVTREEFDIAVLVEGIVALYENQPSIKRLVSRFFSVTSSAAPEDKSTQSE